MVEKFKEAGGKAGSRILEIWFDGATLLSNPSKLIGYSSVFGDRYLMGCLRSPLKDLTNNLAEYLGLELSLKTIKEELNERTQITIYSDSQLVCHQVSGQWSIKDDKPYATKAKECLKLLEELRKLHQIQVVWIPREENSLADDLSKKALKL